MTTQPELDNFRKGYMTKDEWFNLRLDSHLEKVAGFGCYWQCLYSVGPTETPRI